MRRLGNAEEQRFRSICVMTTTRRRERQPVLRKARFKLHTVGPARLVGLKTVWRGGTRVQVSDTARTLIDMLADPALGGGIHHMAEMLGALFRDHPKAVAKLADYAASIGSGAIHKRLGFLLQRDRPDQAALIELCRSRLIAGYAKLDPTLPADRPERAAIEVEWEQMLGHQLPTRPPFEEFWQELLAVFDWLNLDLDSAVDRLFPLATFYEHCILYPRRPSPPG